VRAELKTIGTADLKRIHYDVDTKSDKLSILCEPCHARRICSHYLLHNSHESRKRNGSTKVTPILHFINKTCIYWWVDL